MPYTGPKCKLCRRAGVKLFLKGEKCGTGKCPLVRRQRPPGQPHKKRKRPSSYLLELREKQKAKWIYGVREAQFRRYIREAQKEEDEGKALLSILERRLDNALYRGGVGFSRSHARQMVTHERIKVDGKKVDRPSYQVSPGEVIQVPPQAARREGAKPPLWLKVKGDTIEVGSLPQEEDLPEDLDTSLIFEFYSH